MIRNKNKNTAQDAQTRRAKMDKEKAISAAKNPFESRMGETLIRNHFFHRKALDSEIDKIQQMGRRSFMHLDQQKKRFLQRHVLPEPTIIMERPPSPGVFETESYDSYLWDPSQPPHYMKPLKSRVKSAGVVPTIDMYQVVKKKKVNVWESAMLEREPPQFQSCVVPSYPLSTEEISQMRRDYSIQKRYGLRQGSTKPSSATKSIKTVKSISTKEPPTTVFLTQLVQAQHENECATYKSQRSLSSGMLKERKEKLDV